jgi:2-amino-4-hydroxy-6-hydroxymethyldihydropteridine diphosphokinase
MNKAYLSLGSNEGERARWLRKAIDLITAGCGKILAKSHIYETAAWGITSQADFLNMAVCIETEKRPLELLEAILEIETGMGRERTIKWGPRIIDIDILFYNDEVINLPGLVIPHPYMQDRKFTLTPLEEVAPEYKHPVLQKTVSDLLAECTDKLDVVIIRES